MRQLLQPKDQISNGLALGGITFSQTDHKDARYLYE